MRLMTSILILAMATSAAAQSPSTVTNVRNQLGASSSGSSQTAAKPGLQPATIAKPPIAKQPVPAARATAQPVKSSKPQPAAVKTKAVALPTTTAKAKPPARKTPETGAKKADAAVAKQPKSPAASNRRDPFLSPVMERASQSGGSGCSNGKKCLSPDQITLRGIVRTASANIAVVVTADNRAYFLHENDPIYNGVVTKITENSVTFREQTKDVLGKPASREVVKKMNTPV